MKNNRIQHGFTIVELLIVVVVLGILATITIVSFNGIQKRALNGNRLAEFSVWQKHFEAFRAINGVYPSMPNGNYCLGSGFPNQTCRNWDEVGADSYAEANSAALLSQLGTVGTLPSSMRAPVNGHIGPYVTYLSTSIAFTTFFNDVPGRCPSSTMQVWFSDNGTIMCTATYQR